MGVDSWVEEPFDLAEDAEYAWLASLDIRPILYAYGGLEAVKPYQDGWWLESEDAQREAQSRALSAFAQVSLDYEPGDGFVNLCARDAFPSCAFRIKLKDSTAVNISLSEPQLEGELFWTEIGWAESEPGGTAPYGEDHRGVTADFYDNVGELSGYDPSEVRGILEGRNSWAIADVFSLGARFGEALGCDRVKVFCQPPAGIPVSRIPCCEPGRALSVLQETLGTRGASGEWCYAAVAIQAMGAGKAFVIMTEGSLWGGHSHDARRGALERGLVESVVLLPKQMFPKDALQRAMVVFSRGNESVRFGDLSDDHFPGPDMVAQGFIDRVPGLDTRLGEVLGAYHSFNHSFGDEPKAAVVPVAEAIGSGASFDPRRFCTADKFALPGSRRWKRLGKPRRGTSKAKLEELRQSPLRADEGGPGFPSATILGLGGFSHGSIFGDVSLLGLQPSAQYELGHAPLWCSMTDEEMLDGAYGVVSGTHLIVARTGDPVKVALYVGKKHQRGERAGGAGLREKTFRALREGLIVADNLLCVDLSESEVDPVFALAYFRSDAGQLALKRKMIGRTLKQLSSRDLGDLAIPCPSADDQREIREAYIERWGERCSAASRLAVSEAGLGSLIYDCD